MKSTTSTPGALFSRARILRHPTVLEQPERGGVATIGNFDGVHQGHQRVLSRVKAESAGRTTSVISFYPHPVRVLRPETQLRYISSVREKAEQCGRYGIDLLYFIHFAERIRTMSAQEWIEEVLVSCLGVADLVVGEDVRIGRNREGDLNFLRRVLPQYGIRLHVVERLDVAGIKAGSRKIRELIEQGRVSEAAGVMGGPFVISARVGHGDKLGSSLGFPTANIAVGKRLIPQRGVYACRVAVDGQEYEAVANIGVRPTFNGAGERLEVHILDFPPRNLYGVRIHVAFVERLRSEQRFNSKEELQAQIALDVKAARQRLSNVG